MGAASGPCHGDRRPLGAGEGGWLAIGSARAAWWDSGAIWPPGRSPAQNAVQFSLRWILPPSLPLSLSLAPSLFLRIARAGAGHRWKRIGLPRPGERPADARHPSLVSPAPAVTGARCLVLSGARESRAPLSTPRGVAVGGASRGPRQRCLATAGRFPARRVTRRFQRRLASATRVSENLNRQQRRWARFSGAPDFRRVRRWSRLRSGSPPYVGVWRPTSSLALGHLWASRRPTSLPLRASPSRASRGCPP
jgi:hypothetical protein